jgi:lipid-A-disaccharide synthase-like uncharacterized protein
MDSPVWVYLLGLMGMSIYGVRIVVQWYISEKSRRVESPGIYWIMSSIGAVILYIYGWLRKDFSIIFGESLSYYIYMWNISVMGLYKKVPKILIVIQALFPVAIIALIAQDMPTFVETFLRNEAVPRDLLWFGIMGQFIYEVRSVYQLIYSMRKKESVLPLGYWLMAVVGSLMIIAYGFIRHDWVLVIGQFAIVFSVRNIMLYFISKREEEEGKDAS